MNAVTGELCDKWSLVASISKKVEPLYVIVPVIPEYIALFPS